MGSRERREIGKRGVEEGIKKEMEHEMFGMGREGVREDRKRGIRKGSLKD